MHNMESFVGVGSRRHKTQCDSIDSLQFDLKDWQLISRSQGVVEREVANAQQRISLHLCPRRLPLADAPLSKRADLTVAD